MAYKARYKDQSTVVIKQLLNYNATQLEGFYREADMSYKACLDDRNRFVEHVVPFFGVIVDGAQPQMVYQYVNGSNLLDLLFTNRQYFGTNDEDVKMV